MSYQPVLPTFEPLPSGGKLRYTRAPVAALACKAMSGTPRIEPIGVEPAGSAFWYGGLENTWLKPPPENVQATSLKL